MKLRYDRNFAEEQLRANPDSNYCKGRLDGAKIALSTYLNHLNANKAGIFNDR